MFGGLFLLIILFAAIVSSVVFYRRSKALEMQQQLPGGYGGGGGFTPAGMLPSGGGGNELLNLKINDIVSYFGTDYIIQGRLNYWEDGYTWVTYMLEDGDEVQWLSVEEDDRLEVSMWEEVDDLHVSNPPPEFLEYRGQRFRMTERGEARVNKQGSTGQRKNGLNVKYYEYEGDGEEMISVELWGGEVDVSVGREIRPATLDILPGDQVEY